MSQVGAVLASAGLGCDLPKGLDQGLMIKALILKKTVNALGTSEIASGLGNGIPGLSRKGRQNVGQARVESLIRQMRGGGDACGPNLGTISKLGLARKHLGHRDLETE